MLRKIEFLSAILILLSFCMTCQASPAESARSTWEQEMLERWAAAVDWEHPSVSDLNPEQIGLDAAFRKWIILKLNRLALTDYGQFGWHDYHIHPNRAGIADLLTGVTTPKSYYAKANKDIHFLDVFGISEAISGKVASPINWFVDRRLDATWEGFPKMNTTERMNKSEYMTFEIFVSLVGRYWKTGDTHYRLCLLRLLADFHDRSSATFWADYRDRDLDDADVRAIYQADWRSNTNGLYEAWRAVNTVKMLAALAKVSAPGRTADWADVLHPVDTGIALDAFSYEELVAFGAVLLGLAESYPEKLQWFIEAKTIPNQKMEALNALFLMKNLMPEMKATAYYGDAVDRQVTEFIETTFLADGGMLEQSLNYNFGTALKMKELHYPNEKTKGMAEVAIARFENMVDSLRDPLGDLPQVGNNVEIYAPAVWRGKAERAQHFASIDTDLLAADSVAYPYSGYYVLRNGNEWDSSYLFFKNSRLQRGHRCLDNNGIQLTAFGRPLLIYGGSPDYGRATDPDVKLAAEYLSEASTLKTNTVLVDGYSQTEQRPVLLEAPEQPMPSAWYDSDSFGLVDGVYSGGYGGVKLKNAQTPNGQALHSRSIYFFKQQNVYLVVDRMLPDSDETRQYTQVWNFPPDANTAKSNIDGFSVSEFKDDASLGYIETLAPDGPNLVLLHDGISDLEYESFYGDREDALGWFAPGLTQVLPAMDYHVSWSAKGESVLLTWLVPLREGEKRPERIGSDFSSTLSVIQLSDGTKLGYGYSDKLDVDPSRIPEAYVWIRFPEESKPSKLLVRSKPITAVDAQSVSSWESTEYAWTNGKYSAIKNMPDIRPTSNDSVEKVDQIDVSAFVVSSLPEGARTGLRYGLLDVEKLARIYDGTMRTRLRSGFAQSTESYFGIVYRDQVGVFEGLLEIPEKGDYQLRMTAMRSAMINAVGPEGRLSPPLILDYNGELVTATIHSPKGYLPILLTLTGFHNTEPKLDLELIDLATGDSVPLVFHVSPSAPRN